MDGAKTISDVPLSGRAINNIRSIGGIDKCAALVKSRPPWGWLNLCRKIDAGAKTCNEIIGTCLVLNLLEWRDLGFDRTEFGHSASLDMNATFERLGWTGERVQGKPEKRRGKNAKNEARIAYLNERKENMISKIQVIDGEIAEINARIKA